MLSVGFVHVLAEAQEKLAEVTEYPVGPFLAMIGCITVLALSQVVEGIVTSRRIARRQAALAARDAKKEAAAAEGTAASSAASTAAALAALGLPPTGGVELSAVSEAAASVENGTAGDTVRGSNGGNGESSASEHQQLREHHRQLVEKLSLAKLAVPGGEADGGDQGGGVGGGGQQALQQMDEVALAVLEAGRVPLSEASSLNTPRKSRSNSLTMFESPRNVCCGHGGGGGGALGLSGSGRNYHKSAAARRKDLVERRSMSFQLFGGHGHEHGHGGHNDAAHIVYSFQKESSLVIAYLMEIGASACGAVWLWWSV